jgi:hypothetical protein
MAQLLGVHAQPYLTVVAAAGNAVLTVWAFAAHRMRQRAMAPAFWTVVLVVAAVLAVQMAAGVVLAVAGARPRTLLHLLYGVLVLTGAVVQVGLRPGGFLRAAIMHPDTPFQEPRTLAIVCFTQLLLIARAYTTGALGH